jgi:vacuolar protein sorting-associated protein 54
VLINPRESLYDSMTDEFALDQSEPLDALTISPSSTPPPMTMTPVPGRNIKQIGPSAGHSSAAAGITIANLPSFNTPQEMEDLNRIVHRIQRMFAEYNQTNGPFVFSPPENPNKPTLISPRSVRGESNQFSFGAHVHSIPGPASRESGLARVAAQEAVTACYREVPELFFKHDFSLQVTDTFSNVLVPANRDKQESLSRYLDLVETALLKQIWVRSGAFFRALDDIKGLRGLVSDTITHVNELKNRIRSLDDNLTMSALRIPALQHRRENEHALHSKLANMQKVIEAKKTVRMLLDVDDYVGALQIIDDARNTYNAELSKLRCMIRIGQELDEYHSLIGEVMSNRFVAVAIQWDDDDTELDLDNDDSLSKYLDGGSSRNSNSTNDELYSNSSHAGGVGKSKLSQRQIQMNDQLQDLLHSLLVTGRLQASLGMYESKLCDSIRLIIRTCVLEYISNFDPLVSSEIMQATNDNNDNDKASDAVLSQRVRDMSAENFIACISVVFEHVLMSLRRSQRVQMFMENTLVEAVEDSGMNPRVNLSRSGDDNDAIHATPKKPNKYTVAADKAAGGATSPKEHDKDMLVKLSKKCLHNASSLAQKSIGQLFTLRKDSSAAVKPESMKLMWQVCLKFIAEFEELLGGTSAFVLRQALKNQTKTFLEKLHVANKNKMATALSNDKWNQVDVSPERQSAIDKLTSGKSFLSGLGGHDPQFASAPQQASASAASNGAKKKELKPVTIDNSTYKVVYSGLLLVELTLQYLDIAASFSTAAPDIYEKIVDLHNFFDNRAQSLVLGAGAINATTGLKSISAKHLAVTAQTILLLMALLPHVRAALTAVVPQNQQSSLIELDRTASRLMEHHGLIVGKFVGIVGDSVDISAQKLRGVDWDRFQGQCEYFDEVAKNVAALHRVLIEVLPAELMQEIFSRIFNSLSRKMPSHFEDIMPATETGRQRILDEVTHIISGFSRLKLVDSTGPTSLLEDSFRRRYGRQGV